MDASVVVKSAALALLLGIRGYRRRSLSLGGAIAASAVGFIIGCCGATSTAALLTLYFTGTFLTKFGAKRKKEIETNYVATGNRSAWQVLCNGGVAAAIALYSLVVANGEFPSEKYALALLAQLSALQGDTWSSELGVLSRDEPRLIIGWRQVPRGTNGGVTLWGTFAALMSGVVSGAVNVGFATLYPEGVAGASVERIFTVSVLASVCGSVIDSVLGQFFQQSIRTSSGHIVDGREHIKNESEGDRVIVGLNMLSNNGVNMTTSILVAGGVFALWSEAK